MGEGNNRSKFKGDSLPVAEVSWVDIQVFEERAGLTLPTEAQWEYACRAGRSGPYSGSGVLDEMAWHSGNSGGRSHPIGQKKPNAFGLYDMQGNHWEWCEDIYDAGSYQKTNSGNADPLSTSGSGRRVFRGGSWNRNAQRCRVADRNDRNPARRGDTLGFRPAAGNP